MHGLLMECEFEGRNRFVGFLSGLDLDKILEKAKAKYHRVITELNDHLTDKGIEQVSVPEQYDELGRHLLYERTDEFDTLRIYITRPITYADFEPLDCGAVYGQRVDDDHFFYLMVDDDTQVTLENLYGIKNLVLVWREIVDFHEIKKYKSIYYYVYDENCVYAWSDVLSPSYFTQELLDLIAVQELMKPSLVIKTVDADNKTDTSDYFMISLNRDGKNLNYSLTTNVHARPDFLRRANTVFGDKVSSIKFLWIYTDVERNVSLSFYEHYPQRPLDVPSDTTRLICNIQQIPHGKAHFQYILKSAKGE